MEGPGFIDISESRTLAGRTCTGSLDWVTAREVPGFSSRVCSKVHQFFWASIPIFFSFSDYPSGNLPARGAGLINMLRRSYLSLSQRLLAIEWCVTPYYRGICNGWH